MFYSMTMTSIQYQRLLFPKITALIDTISEPVLGLSIVDIFFPEWAQRKCIPSVWPLTKFRDGVMIRFPALIPLQICGTAIGMYGLVQIVWQYPTYRKELLKHWAWSHHWNWAFIFFMLMNISSVPAHSFLEPGRVPWQCAWTADVITTGMCSVNLLLVGVEIIQEQIEQNVWRRKMQYMPTTTFDLLDPPVMEHPRPLTWNTDMITKVEILNLALLLVLCSVTAIAWPWRSELVYLLPTAFAAAALAAAIYGQLRRNDVRNDERRALMQAMLLGGGICAVAPFSDSVLCYLTGSGLFGFVHLFFLGADLGMFFLLTALMAARYRIIRTKAKAG